MAVRGSGRDHSKRTPEQERLILDNLKLARMCARKVAGKIGNEIEMQELESEAFLALVVCAGGYKPELGFKFSTYACNSIFFRLWRFLDVWRELTLTHREAIKKGIANDVRRFSLDYPIPGSEMKFSDVLPDNRDEVLAWMERMSMRMQIMDLMKRARLTPTEQECMKRVYLDGVEITEVVKERGCCRQAVHQALTHGFEKLSKTARRDESRLAKATAKGV